MYLEFVALVLCVIGGQFVSPEKAVPTKNKDVWETMQRSDVFFLLRRTYRWSKDRSVCSYTRILERNEEDKTLLTLGGNYNNGTTDYNNHKIYVTTRKGKKGERNHMMLSVVGYGGPAFEYKMIFDDGGGCSVLNITRITQPDVPKEWIGQCELWATKEVALSINVQSSCEVTYFQKCNPDIDIEDTPYVTNCKDPPTDTESEASSPEC
ncbi:uncharacterized protein LOC135392538 [Ornithodoros turicata]|uniref:uncharacterized protein LOC135392538 n=1 Tax=Ornithodoros turicata TaxID=34597 RepID=UPI003139B41D